MAKQECTVNIARPEGGGGFPGNRWWAKSINPTNCRGRNANICENIANCYRGYRYEFNCSGKLIADNVACGLILGGAALCKANVLCKYVRSSVRINECYSRCAGCMYVTDQTDSQISPTSIDLGRFNLLTGLISTTGNKLMIGSEADGDFNVKFLINKDICTKTDSW